MINIQYESCPALPQLAWVCCIVRATGKGIAYHGSSVEQNGSWLVEGTWDGAFIQGEFHSSTTFFGSGFRVGNEAIIFVPSRALVDRLLYCVDDKIIAVSNSLPLLLAYTGDSLDKDHDYRVESSALLGGIKNYDNHFHVFASSKRQYYQLIYENMTWVPDQLSFSIPEERQKIDCFAAYESAFSAALKRVSQNYSDLTRKKPMYGVTTVSSGYDSTATAAAVKSIGVQESFTSPRSNSVLPRWLNRSAVEDSGAPVAHALGMKCSYLLPRKPPVSDAELYFLAASCSGKENLFHPMADTIEKRGRPVVVFTGYHGDKIWDLNVDEYYISPLCLRGDSSGLGLSEIRLKAGFVNAAIPFIFSRRMRDIVRISRSEEMRPWRLNNAYDRPIPRRMAESAGVPRSLFGHRKKAVWEYYWFPRSKIARDVVSNFIRNHLELSPKAVARAAFARRSEFVVSILVGRLRRLLPFFPSLQPTAGDSFNLPSVCYVAANQALASRFRLALPKKEG